MAAAKRRNGKTHPKATGDDGPADDFVPPDRQDVFGNDGGGTEVVDIFGRSGTEVAADDGPVDLNSAVEGDGRSMASEDGGGGSDVAGAARGDGAADDSRGAQRASVPRGEPRTARGSDDDDSSFSRRTRQRIQRERALVNRERALREQTQQQLAEERAANQATQERIARLERAQTEVAGNATVKELEGKIETTRTQFVAAMEGGESAKAAELGDKLSDLRTQLGILKYDLQQKAARATAVTPNQPARVAPVVDNTTVVDNPEVKQLADAFIKANRHWWNRSAFRDAKADAITIDKEILRDIAAGELEFEPYTDEHFEETARRLHESYPDLEIQDLDGRPYQFNDEEDDVTNDRGRGSGNGRRQDGGRQDNRQPSRGAAPMGRMGQNGRRAPTAVDLARQGKVEIDQSLRDTIRIFKQDPNDPTVKKYFARERARSILRGEGPGQNDDNRGNR